MTGGWPSLTVIPTPEGALPKLALSGVAQAKLELATLKSLDGVWR
jgi:hypothetical protein